MHFLAVDCDFEVDMCNWINVPGYKAWRRWRGSTPSSNTGPTVDHTYGNRNGNIISYLILLKLYFNIFH